MINIALTCLKKIRGSTEFDTSVVVLVQFVQTVM